MRYRYYISLPLLEGCPQDAGSISRVPAADVEKMVEDAMRRELGTQSEQADGDLLATHFTRVEVKSAELLIDFKDQADGAKVIRVPWQKPPFKRRREILYPASGRCEDSRPIRADARARLVAALSRGRRWLDEMLSSTATSIEEIARREGCSVGKVNMTLSLAFLAPDLIKAAIEGRLPRGTGIARLSDLPANWSEQFHRLGIAERKQ